MYVIFLTDGSRHQFPSEDLLGAQKLAVETRVAAEDDPSKPALAQIFVAPKNAVWAGKVTYNTFVGLALTADGGVRHMPATMASYKILETVLHDEAAVERIPPPLLSEIGDYLTKFHYNLERNLELRELALRRQFDDMLERLYLETKARVPGTYFRLVNRPIHFVSARLAKAGEWSKSPSEMQALIDFNKSQVADVLKNFTAADNDTRPNKPHDPKDPPKPPPGG